MIKLGDALIPCGSPSLYIAMNIILSAFYTKIINIKTSSTMHTTDISYKISDVIYIMCCVVAEM